MNETNRRQDRQSSHRLSALQQEIRTLLACEIHDGLAQKLASALMLFQAYEEQRDDPHDHPCRPTFERAIALLKESLGEARRLIDGLQPPMLAGCDIVAAVGQLISQSRRQHAAEIDYVHSVRSEHLHADTETSIFRIVQEALSNALRHSKCDKVRVQLIAQNAHVFIEIRDWGTGFEPESVDGDRFGLRSIQARAELVGGWATVESVLGEGTRVTAELPLEAELAH